MDAPQSVSDLRRLLGMVNHLGKFSPRLADICQPLRGLLSAKNSWLWGPTQEKAFANLKKELTQPTVLALYDPAARSKISADASSFGLGAVLLQQNQDAWKPVADLSPRQSDATHRLRKRRWLLHGPVRNSQIKYWGNTSNLKLTINPWSLSLATNSWMLFPLVFSVFDYDWTSLTIQSSMSQGRSSTRQTPSQERPSQ